MKITLITVGKLKEDYLKNAVQEYEKRLSRYCKLDIVELADERAPENMSISQEIEVKNREGSRIMRYMNPSSYVIALAIDGAHKSSEELASHIEKLGVQGNGHLTFVIGGSLGLSDEVLQQCNEKLSFSKMTFPHQLMRVILLEQVYRCFRINLGEPYHK
ncbi:MAG: 23S rRNA (pseudouridine(1915)-N(3))-methyltransferase RlmH [Firmicutes bacterium HGW-Firmicutes-1]|nr:MAG: 23S rRNA (pseudouridine(1915)-N(3))-methyltransferase RlmH [Firmicutes bacterium HGW-Firmicutes-1]